MTLVEFIEAQYAKREAIARKAASLQLDPEEGWGIDGRAITPHIGVIHEDDPREHIALHNPAFVLADIASKRAILKLHNVISFEDEDGSDIGRGCVECGYSAEYSDQGGWCETVRLLAAPFSVEPGYDERWAV